MYGYEYGICIGLSTASVIFILAALQENMAITIFGAIKDSLITLRKEQKKLVAEVKKLKKKK
jgi:hypothetical protein